MSEKVKLSVWLTDKGFYPTRSQATNAIKDGKVVKTVTRAPMTQAHIHATVSSHTLKEKSSYDVAAVRLKAVDENGNLLNYFNEGVNIKIDGPLELIGQPTCALRGGMGGIYLKTVAKSGKARVIISCLGCQDTELEFTVE
jgi:beta-galactosidase